jgi:hypothetical protein
MRMTPIHQKPSADTSNGPVRFWAARSRMGAIPMLLCAVVCLSGCSEVVPHQTLSFRSLGGGTNESGAGEIHVAGNGGAKEAEDNPLTTQPEPLTVKEDNPLEFNEAPAPHADDALDVMPDTKKPSTYRDLYRDTLKDPLLNNTDPGMASKLPALDALGPGDVPRMPTDHSHWLRGGIFNAKVGVYVNNVKLGDFISPVDKDITWHLHKGVNSVTFIYDPMVETASAQLDIVESEHHPDIAPLASFRSDFLTQKPIDTPSYYQYGDAVAKRSTKTYSFMAH